MIPSSTVAVGVQGGSFEAFHRGLDVPVQRTSLCCTLVKGHDLIDTKIVPITVDGLDATVNIVNILQTWEMDVIILGGATFAGFNVVDVEIVYEAVKKPIIVHMLKHPNMKATLDALKKHFPDWKERWRRYELLGDVHGLVTEKGVSYFEVYEEVPEFAKKVLSEQSIYGRVPEAVRLADLIAKGTSPVFQGREGSRYESSS